MFRRMESNIIEVTRTGRRIEIAPKYFGILWDVIFPSETNAQKYEEKLKKLTQEELTELYNQGKKIPYNFNSYDADSIRLIKNFLKKSG